MQRNASKKIRICHVSMCLSTGGLERLLVEFARRTDPQKFDLQFVALGKLGTPAEEIRSLGHRVTSLSETSAAGRLGKFRELAKLFRNEQIDVIHSHNTYAHFYSALAGRYANVPVILNTQHGRGCGPHWKQRLHFFLANRLAHQVLAVSEDSARICQQQDRWSRPKISALWNGIDLQRFAYHGPANHSTAISVARLSPEKDFGTLIRATALVVREFPDFHLTLVGDGPERSFLEELTAQLELTRQVTFLGERNDVPALLKQAAMFVSSSSTEGISLTLLEAMAVGLPIVTTAVGGNPEVVQDEVTGYLVPACNPKRLAEAICLHLRQKDTWQAMGELARNRVEQQFNIERMIREYEEIYSRQYQQATRFQAAKLSGEQ